MGDITIYHNPACGTSRNVLALIRNSGEEPTVIEYLKTPREAPERYATRIDTCSRSEQKTAGADLAPSRFHYW